MVVNGILVGRVSLSGRLGRWLIWSLINRGRRWGQIEIPFLATARQENKQASQGGDNKITHDGKSRNQKMYAV